ncbi:hypothetical protein [Bacillus sp. V5-8f]|uniref:hypothetical protein n=1 Tax=Bacillus sp. V5-8f TaxID=2053044 RepID=UPI000C76CDA8|nr:hypothetical protein [Bacillus sp. V5-8f]PLT33258.1 hypothetical protein CUU64_14520 [Bacillus sp. V5-8f]
MNVIIEIQIESPRGNFSRKGKLLVKPSDFKRDPDETAAIAAFEWLREIRLVHGFNLGEHVVQKVIYNGEHDITEIVHQLHPMLDDLPF